MEIRKDMTIMDIIRQDEDIADLLMAAGMHCLGCVAAHGETLDEACQVHGINTDALLALINQFEASKAEQAAE